MRRKILSIAWGESLAARLLAPVAGKIPADFAHVCLTTTAAESMRLAIPSARVIDLGMPANGPFPAPDLALLASLEGEGIPTINNIILGDRVLRNLPPEEARRYVSALAGRLVDALGRERPDIVLGGFDSAHAALSLAASRRLGIPWVAMHFSAIPQGLMNFCTGISPNTPLPIRRPIDDALRAEAKRELAEFLNRQNRVLAVRSAHSVGLVIRRLPTHARRLAQRLVDRATGRLNRFNEATPSALVRQWLCKRKNLLLLGRTPLMGIPPEERFAFFPLHMQPESSIDAWAPFQANQFYVVEQIARAIPTDMTLAVKIHFSDADNYSPKDLARLLALPGVKLVDPKALSRDFLKRSSIVFGIMGTACLEAALCRKPVIMFGNSPYLDLPGVSRAERPDQLPALVRSMLAAPPATEAQLEAGFMKYLSQYMPATLNDWNTPLSEDDIERYCSCFLRLFNHLAGPATRA